MPRHGAYLPESWVSDPGRRAAAGIAEGTELAAKPELALRMITRALDAGTPAQQRRLLPGCSSIGSARPADEELLVLGVHHILRGGWLLLPPRGDMRS